MNQKSDVLETCAGIRSGLFSATVACLWLVTSSITQASPRLVQGDDAGLKAITVSFKLDPRLSGGTYGGERWVSPPIFTSAAQEGDEATVGAKVQGVDSAGSPVSVFPEWTPADPEMVSVTSGPNGEFSIRVKGTGESTVKLAAAGILVELAIEARRVSGRAIQVTITRQRPAAPVPLVPVPQADAARESVLPDLKSKRSYAFGVEVGHGLMKDALGLDGELVARGIRDALAGSTLMVDSDLKAALSTLRSDVRVRQAAAANQRGEKNRMDGAAFLAENKTREGVVALPSGLQYKVLKEGEGKRPLDEDTVVCRYRGTFVDGQEFDSSDKRRQPATGALRRMIKGWREALRLMPVGSKWEVVVPPDLAYGPRGSGRLIGPDATLVFELELLAIKDVPKKSERTAAPSTPEEAGKS